MRYTDIAIFGGGLAGLTAAAMLGRADISSVLIDPHESYPADFRVEKLSGQEQLGRFSRTGIAESVLRRRPFPVRTESPAWAAARQGAEPAVQHPLRFPGQRRPRRNPRFRRAHLRQGHERDGCGQERRLLHRSGEAGLRSMAGGESL
ncbi:FAD-dependent monooxygenase [Bradyrhizobium symbiodeficiens]|uniref:FAD-dependent monooxygenase n=1 Tax=Bradyrhizobium symbiodeficiens TaxID=1404367 RepID=UPI003BAFB955